MKFQATVTSYDPGLVPATGKSYPRFTVQEAVSSMAFGRPITFDVPIDARDKAESWVDKVVEVTLRDLSQTTFGGLVRLQGSGKLTLLGAAK